MEVISALKTDKDAGTQMSKEQVKQDMNDLGKLFDYVRLLKADEVGGVAKKTPVDDRLRPCKCYDFWNKESQCENCISMKALYEKRQRTKLEIMGSDVFQVFARYVVVDGEPCVIEYIKRLDEDSLVGFDNNENLKNKLSKYQKELYRDALTGAYNRRYFEDKIKNSRMSAGVVMIDVDDFKLYNDTCGHDVGDLVLDTIVKVIRKCIRKSDILVRYGGDEFLLVMPEINEEDFPIKLKQIQRRINNCDIPGYSKIHVSVSIGGVLADDEPLEDAATRADKLMYQAKTQKNIVVTENTELKLKTDSKKEKVLIVDDSEMNREILSEMLSNEYDILEAADGKECLQLLSDLGSEISVVLLDIVMSGMDGFEVLNVMNDHRWLDDIPVIMISSEDSVDSIRRAYGLGVSDYMSRPFDAKVVYQRVDNTIKLYAKQRKLLSLVTDQMREKEKNNEMMIAILSHIVEFRNGEGGKHVLHIKCLTEMLLDRLLQKTDKYMMNSFERYLISLAASLHDIGKIGIDENILNKPAKLTKEEFEEMKKHTVIGESMLKGLDFYADEPLIRVALQICRWHHERYDGCGYPDGLKGDEIPISAQIVSLADVYDALVSERVYKKAYSHEKAISMILGGECGTFNPLLLECLADIQDKLKVVFADNDSNEE